MGIVKRQRAETQPIHRFAVKRGALLPVDMYNRRARLANGGDRSGAQSGESGGRTPYRRILVGETGRRPPGFVEGNRGIPQPRRDYRSAVGKARGDAGSPAPARQCGLGLCLPGRVGPVGPQSESSGSAGKCWRCSLVVKAPQRRQIRESQPQNPDGCSYFGWQRSESWRLA